VAISTPEKGRRAIRWGSERRKRKSRKRMLEDGDGSKVDKVKMPWESPAKNR